MESITKLIGRYTTLRKENGVIVGDCPFCKGKDSLRVNTEKNVFFCFSCGINGNRERFFCLAKNSSGQSAKKKPGEIISANKKAALYYNRMLHTPEGNTTLSYIKKRGITSSSVKNFGLGYAPGRGTCFLDYCKQIGISIETAEKAGLTFDTKWGRKDAFRDRLLFPVFHDNGDIIGFSGRRMQQSDTIPKYINTRETEVFDKSRNLYGLYQAKNHLLSLPREERTIILVEGNVDVIMMHQAGFSTTVAPLGTAFTEEQAHKIKQFTDHVILALDNDNAGRTATYKAIHLLRPLHIKTDVLYYGKDVKDPADAVLKYGAKQMHLWVKKAIPALSFEVQYLSKKENYKENLLHLMAGLEEEEREAVMRIAAKLSNRK